MCKVLEKKKLKCNNKVQDVNVSIFAQDSRPNFVYIYALKFLQPKMHV